jgi:hypothetical protein
MYQHIEFINGSNPYISKTEKDFKRMCEKYLLIPVAENCWKATDRIYYIVVGFTDKNKTATFDKDYKSKEGAMRVIRKAIEDHRFECIMLRKVVEDLRNNAETFYSLSDVPLKQWTLTENGEYKKELYGKVKIETELYNKILYEERYESKTSMDNLITNILLAVDNAIEDGTDIIKEDPQDIIWWVKEQGGLSEFDYEA